MLINPTSPLTTWLISEHHDTPEGGHSGYVRTIQKLRKMVYWKGMKNSVRTYIKNYDVCQRSKWENIHPAGILQPLPIPEQV